MFVHYEAILKALTINLINLLERIISAIHNLYHSSRPFLPHIIHRYATSAMQGVPTS